MEIIFISADPIKIFTEKIFFVSVGDNFIDQIKFLLKVLFD